ncbi:hypothetical protein DUI87_15146 [Hirundo rustica rustica]|uniref:Uncharacterized protein n=1 Tax=Hirundo rustica rustica TaxID=333673 RepID=A0A3M0K9V2_HIRRU|nr:hypothetical protein DUI87_15146 [Hirundo rustica rustica]
MQLYQPGARSRSRLCQYEDSAAKPPDQGVDKKQEASNYNREENLCEVERLYGLKFDNKGVLVRRGRDLDQKPELLRQLEPVLDALQQTKLGAAWS